jgi:hypothetical protein
VGRRRRRLGRRSFLGIGAERRSQIDCKTLDREAEHGETCDCKTLDKFARKIFDGRRHPRFDGAQASGQAVHGQAFDECSEILRRSQASTESAGAAAYDGPQAADQWRNVRRSAERRR